MDSIRIKIISRFSLQYRVSIVGEETVVHGEEGSGDAVREGALSVEQISAPVVDSGIKKQAASFSTLGTASSLMMDK